MLLLVDNGSVFTKNISDFLLSTGADFKTFCFDTITLDSLRDFDSFILSGRRSNNRHMNSLNAKIIRHCTDQSKKLLGICYGAELLALTLGGTIRKMTHLQKGNERVDIIQKTPLVSGSIEVYQSHMYEISNLGDCLVSVATSLTSQHQIIVDKKYRIFGTQFHPEMTSDGHGLIGNFLDL